MGDRKATIKNSDMPEEMQQEVIEVAIQAIEKFSSVEKEMAQYIKREFDKRYHLYWHCIVGKNFGSCVSNETGNFIYFFIG